MTLADLFARIGPFLDGRADADEARRMLWGEGVRSADAERIDIYGRFCRNHRFAALEGIYPHTRDALVRLDGAPAWERLVEDYFRACPMHHVELSENGAALPGFLDGWTSAAGLPGWLAEVADLEWWEWRTRMAPDDPADAQADGPLRLAATVELRPYRHDLVGWLDGAAPASAPDTGERLVLFWRDRDGDPRREDAAPIELWALKAVSEALGDAPDGVAAEDWRETLDDLRQAGILVGGR